MGGKNKKNNIVWEDQLNAKLTPIEDKEKPKVDICKAENIIFIGSELLYCSFWTKMMFIGAATKQINMMSEEEKKKTIIAYVPFGYTNLELGVIEHYKNANNMIAYAVRTANDAYSLIAANRNIVKIRNLYFFCHGTPGVLSLNYSGAPKIDLARNFFSPLASDIFIEGGKIYSYSCRTGVSLSSEKFDNDDAALPKLSLACSLAKKFGIDVHAFLVRTDYKDVLRQHSKIISDGISSQLKEFRSTGGDDKSYDIVYNNESYQALPHDDIDDDAPFYENFKRFFIDSAKKEGTKNYVLWRNNGGRCLPSGASTPEGLSRTMKKFSCDGSFS